MTNRKILISPGFGAGWSSWMDHNVKGLRKFAAEYQPFIDALEAGEPLDADSFLDDVATLFGKDVADEVYILTRNCHTSGGLPRLVVHEVSGPYIVQEYDGSESVLERDKVEWK